MSNLPIISSNFLQNVNEQDRNAIEKVLLEGDLKPLSVSQRVAYYNARCLSLGLDPLSRPFDYILYQGKLVLYANKNCAEQLRRIKNVSIKVTARDKHDTLVCITVQASTPDGRFDESSAYLDMSGMSGKDLANAYMKLETKAKRRATLSICGLGMNDESEWETVEHSIPVSVNFDDPKIVSNNLENAKEKEKIEEQKKPRNETPVNASQLKQLIEKGEMIGVKSSDFKSVNEQLWAITKTSEMKVWQFELLFDFVTKSKTRDDFGKIVAEYEVSK